MQRHTRITALALVLMASVGLGCVGGSKSKKVNKEALKQYILSAPPTDIPNKLNAVFEGKAKLIGYRISPDKTAKPGSEIKLTMYWQCLEDVPKGWLLFTHVLAANGNRIEGGNFDNVGPLRQWSDSTQALPPGEWQKGKVYVDEQTFKLPPKLDTHQVTIVTGIWKAESRLKITSGPHDKENRAIVAHLSTGQSKKPKPFTGIKNLRPPKLGKTDKIQIDGKLDDKAWKKAASTGPFVDVGSGRRNPSFPVQGSAKLAWDDDHLYVAFQVRSKTIVGGFPKDAKDPHLWEKDTIEIMIDPDGDGDNKDYYEIQINPQNLVFDTQYDGYNRPKDDSKNVFGHMDWSSDVKSAVVVDGEIDKPNKGKGYVVEAKIPWSSFSKAKQTPPKPGDRWRMNFYAMKNNSGVAWSPILGKGNFHRASCFGRVVWTIPGQPLPSASGSAAASAKAKLPKVPRPPKAPKTPKAPASK